MTYGTFETLDIHGNQSDYTGPDAVLKHNVAITQLKRQGFIRSGISWSGEPKQRCCCSFWSNGQMATILSITVDETAPVETGFDRMEDPIKTFGLAGVSLH